MTKIIAFINQKGGSAKTTSTLNLGALVAKGGARVLLVDADPQSNLSLSVGINIFDDTKRLSDVLVDEYELRKIILSYRDNLYIAPTDLHLAKVELTLLGEFNREYRLRDALDTVKSEYDYIFIDCPPSLAMMAINSLAAANYVFIPSSCDYLSMLGVQILYTTLLSTKKKINPSLKILGLLRTRFDSRTNHSKEIAQKTEKMYSKYMHVFNTVIRESTQLKDALVHHQTIFEYDPKCNGAEDYQRLYEEFVGVIHDQEKP